MKSEQASIASKVGPFVSTLKKNDHHGRDPVVWI